MPNFVFFYLFIIFWSNLSIDHLVCYTCSFFSLIHSNKHLFHQKFFLLIIYPSSYFLLEPFFCCLKQLAFSDKFCCCLRSISTRHNLDELSTKKFLVQVNSLSRLNKKAIFVICDNMNDG